MKLYILILQRRLWLTGHQDKIIKHSTWNMSGHFRNWAVRKENIYLILMTFLDLKETVFVLCLFLTSKNASMES